jgi:hypothetical protein
MSLRKNKLSEASEQWKICGRKKADDKLGITVIGEYPHILHLIEVSKGGGITFSLPPDYQWAWSEKDPDAVVIKRKVS